MARKITGPQAEAMERLSRSNPFTLRVLNTEHHQDGEVVLFCRTLQRRSVPSAWGPAATEMYRIALDGTLTPV